MWFRLGDVLIKQAVCYDKFILLNWITFILLTTHCISYSDMWLS